MRLLLRLLLIGLIAAGTAAVAGGASTNHVADMRIIGDAARTRFVVDLDKDPQYGLLRLTNPYRLVIDMPEVVFDKPATAPQGRGIISDYRYGLIAPGKARIVLDLTGPAQVVNSFVIPPGDGQPARFTVDMVPTSADAFAAAAREDRPRRLAAVPPQPERAPSAEESGRPIVVIDPGHGGIDSGAVGKDGTLEKDLTLKFGLELAAELKKDGKIEPILTREDDTFLSLGDRVEVAQQHHAALFISIHADTVRQNYVRGATVYTLSDEASDALSQALAEQENRSDILAGLSLEDQPDDVADILFDLARRETKNLSVRFAKSLVGDMKGDVALNNNPWRRAAFRVLKAPDVPSVLLEMGYLSNADDEKMFKSNNWPAGEAEKVARAVETFVGQRVTAGQ
jgi:N-acetylmuramoyl-L-alanine amidase